MVLQSNRIGIFASLIFAASTLHAESAMDCVREITMPNSYLFVYQLLPATIQVHITIGNGGKAASVEYGNANSIFQLQLDRYFKTALYAESCAGKTIDFNVRYVVEGQKSSSHSSEVRFKQPNDFTVVCRPLEPNLEPLWEREVRPNPKKK